MKHSNIIICIAICAAPLTSLAYIDPGSGSALMSAIIGFFVAMTMVIKTYWYKIINYCKNLFQKTEKKQTNDKEKV